MRNNFWRFAFLLIAALLVLPMSVLANPDLPKGLEDRGPLTKITFIHYRKGRVKPPSAGTSKKQTSCYSYLASGAKWKTPEDYFVNSSLSGLDSSFVMPAVTQGAVEWENYGGPNIFRDAISDDAAV